MAKDTLTFKVDSQLMEELGERLVSKNYIALAELIKNSYDADATEVKIEMRNTTSKYDKKGQIKVIDNGHGMSKESVETKWMRIATTNKRYDKTSPKYGRPRTGRKGIGRFACQRLAKELHLETTALNQDNKLERTTVSFNWKDKFKPGEDLESVEFEYDKNLASGKTTGTSLALKKLVEKWTQSDYDVLRRQILMMTVAKDTQRKGYERDPGMKIEITAPEFEDKEKTDLYEEFKEAGWGSIKGKITRRGEVKVELDAKDLGRKKFTFPKKYPKLAGVEIDIHWVPRVNKKNLRKPEIIRKYVTEEIKEHAGIRIYQNNFRIFPYGNVDNDWLNINRDQSLSVGPAPKIFKTEATKLGVQGSRPMLYMPRNDSLFGGVYIKGTASKNFEQKIDREGLLENEAFRELREVARGCIDWATLWYAVFFLQRKKKEAEESKEEYEKSIKETSKEHSDKGKLPPEKSTAESALKYIREQTSEYVKEEKVNSQEKDNKETENLEKAFNTVEDHFEKVEAQLNLLRNVATINSIMLTFSHEARSLVEELGLRADKIRALKRYLPEEKKGEIDEITSSLNDTKERFRGQLRLFGLLADKPEKKYKHDAREILENIQEAFKFVLDKYHVKTELDIKKGTTTPKMHKQEFYTISINLISNAIKAVLAAGTTRIMVETDTDNKKEFKMRVYDEGVGLPEQYRESVFNPLEADPQKKIYQKLKKLDDGDLFSFGQGTGLGLSIVRDIISENYGGEIRFLDTKKPWSTCVEVKIPW